MVIIEDAVLDAYVTLILDLDCVGDLVTDSDARSRVSLLGDA